MTSSRWRFCVAHVRKSAFDELGYPLALVVRRDDDGQIRSRSVPNGPLPITIVRIASIVTMPLRAHRALIVGLLAAVAMGAALRGGWLTSDPPTHAATGIVWHDEGPWVHNARNRALWGTWRTDEWNPVFLTPVFTGLEYLSFEAFGVGTWQARLVPVASGLAAVLLIGLGLAVSGRSRGQA